MAKCDDLTKLMKKFVKDGPAGCGCAVAKDGDILFEDYVGYANKEEEKLINEDTVFRLYSMTKVIVCTAAIVIMKTEY